MLHSRSVNWAHSMHMNILILTQLSKIMRRFSNPFDGQQINKLIYLNNFVCFYHSKTSQPHGRFQSYYVCFKYIARMKQLCKLTGARIWSKKQFESQRPLSHIEQFFMRHNHKSRVPWLWDSLMGLLVRSYIYKTNCRMHINWSEQRKHHFNTTNKSLEIILMLLLTYDHCFTKSSLPTLIVDPLKNQRIQELSYTYKYDSKCWRREK